MEEARGSIPLSSTREIARRTSSRVSEVATIDGLIDLVSYPLDAPGSNEWAALVARCRDDLAADGMYELPGFLTPEALRASTATILPRMANESVEIRREHNIYFLDTVAGLADDHPALKKMLTLNHTLCGDQLMDTPLADVYEWPHFREFIAATMGLPELHLMDDELARVNVLSYRPGEALNWHFDRSEFTVTILLQRAAVGGVFEYRRDLRSDDDPNYAAVGRVIAGGDPAVRRVDVAQGALNVFRGRNTAHRVTTVAGDTERLVAVFSFYDRPGVRFSDSERLGFYRRA